MDGSNFKFIDSKRNDMLADRIPEPGDLVAPRSDWQAHATGGAEPNANGECPVLAQPDRCIPLRRVSSIIQTPLGRLLAEVQIALDYSGSDCKNRIFGCSIVVSVRAGVITTPLPKPVRPPRKRPPRRRRKSIQQILSSSHFASAEKRTGQFCAMRVPNGRCHRHPRLDQRAGPFVTSGPSG